MDEIFIPQFGQNAQLKIYSYGKIGILLFFDHVWGTHCFNFYSLCNLKLQEKSFSLVFPRGLKEMRINKNKLVEQNVQGKFSSMCETKFQVF